MNELGRHELELTHDVVDFLGPDVPADLTTCDREPIHLSGAIQPHGVLLAVREADMSVRRASANAEWYLGLGPSELLGQPLSRALGSEPVARLRLMLRDPSSSGADPLVLHLPDNSLYELTWHRVGAEVVLELEPSSVSGGVFMSGLFNDLRHAMGTLEAAQGVQALCDVAAVEIKRLTGYDRVMVYRFHRDQHGEVVAEQREADQESFLGLNYPASDIPRQARKLYLLNRLRVIADVSYEPSALLGLSDGDGTLDLSMSSLRSVSPFHLAYLTNMGVRATLTISLMQGTRLWGMLSCHHRAPRRIDAQLRAACRVLGQMFSLQLVAQENLERHAYRTRLAEIEVQLVARLSGASSLAGALVAGAPSPLLLASADGLVARLDGQTVTAGSVPPREVVDALLVRLRAGDDPSVAVYDDLPHRFSELATHAQRASGVLAIPMSGGYGDFVLWFRGELVRELKWAGNPEKVVSGDLESFRLSPRQSFETWAEEVRGHCRPWLAAEIDAAHALAGAIPKILLARATDHLAYLAMHDQLTGLPNRALLLDRTAQALARRERGGGELAMLFIDLDRFKLVNDSFGHAAGDDLLRQAAQRLNLAIRDTDTAARIGGDEFIVLCEGTTPDQAQQVSDRIIHSFRSPFTLEGQETLVTASIGIAVGERDATPAGLLHDADTAMYRAKHSGRNSVAAFTREMRTITLDRDEIETRLRSALERESLQVYFQPMHNVNGVLTGFEALARWPLAGRGMIPPSEFIPIAETAGLIDPLTDWVLDRGLAALADWRQQRPELDLTLAVNITAVQMGNDSLPHSIDSALRRHQLPGRALCLEIGEGALVADDPRNLQLLHRLRAHGVRLSIDAFGTGLAAMSYLTKLPVHELKIDRAFITGLPAASANVAVVASAVGLAHQLGLQALAVGVETDDEIATVRRLGCDLVQGYLLGRPMPAEEINRYLNA